MPGKQRNRNGAVPEGVCGQISTRVIDDVGIVDGLQR